MKTIRLTSFFLLILFGLTTFSCGSQGATEHEDVPDEHADHSPAIEQVVLDEAQMQAAGVTVQAVQKGQIQRTIRLPAVVVADADALTHINPKAAGLVRSIHKHLGDRVRQGDLLCVIDSMDLGRAVTEYVRAQALKDAAIRTLAKEEELFARRLQAAETMLQGEVEVHEKIKNREQELQEQAVSTIRPLLEAEKALSQSQLKKERELTELRTERDSRILALQVLLQEREIDLKAAQSLLWALGVGKSDLENLLPSNPLLNGSYEIRAPRDGVVSGRHITVGEFVDGTTKLYTLEDLSQVWVLGSVFEEQLQAIRTGQEGWIFLDAFPGRKFAGKVTLLGYEIDAESRSLGVRLELPNPHLENWPEPDPIRPGMFGTMELVVDSFWAERTIPESAVVHEADGNYAFVRIADGVFEQRKIEIGPPAGELVEVLQGLDVGEEVVVAGTFHLKSALRKGELGGGHSH